MGARRYCTGIYQGRGATAPEFIIRERRYCTGIYQGRGATAPEFIKGEALLYFSMASRSLLFYGSGFINIIGGDWSGNHEQSAVNSAQTPAPFRGEVPGDRPAKSGQHRPNPRLKYWRETVQNIDSLTLLVKIVLFTVSRSWLRSFCSWSYTPGWGHACFAQAHFPLVHFCNGGGGVTDQRRIHCIRIIFDERFHDCLSVNQHNNQEHFNFCGSASELFNCTETQECIPVGCEPPTHRPYLPGPGGGGGGDIIIG